MTGLHGFFYLFSHFSYGFIGALYLVNLFFVVFGVIAFKNPSFADFQRLSAKPKTLSQKTFKTFSVIWIIVMLTLMNIHYNNI